MSDTIESKPAIVADVELFDRRNPLRRLHVAIVSVGDDLNKSVLAQVLWNPNCGHPAGIQFRSKYSAKRFGSLDDWREGAIELRDATEVDAVPKTGATVTIVERYLPTAATDTVTGLFPDRDDLMAAGGTATLVSKPESKLGNGAPVTLLWSAVYPSRLIRLSGDLAQDEEVKRGLAIKAIKENWPIGQYGEFSDFKLKEVTFCVGRLLSGLSTKIDCTPKR